MRLSKESGMQKTRLPSAIPDTILLNTGLRKLIRVRVIFIICLKLIIGAIGCREDRVQFLGGDDGQEWRLRKVRPESKVIPRNLTDDEEGMP